MNTPTQPDTDQLLASAAAGDTVAGDQLLQRHRDRLRGLISIRMDSRLAGRLDPSDVVQETLLVAHRRLPAYLQNRQVPFYPWLREIALNRLTDLYRRHVQAQFRSVDREEPAPPINDRSAVLLAERLLAHQSSPSQPLLRDEAKRQVIDALKQLPERQREIVVMRHLEELSVAEIAGILDIPPGTVMSRHFRGLRCAAEDLE